MTTKKKATGTKAKAPKTAKETPVVPAVVETPVVVSETELEKMTRMFRELQAKNSDLEKYNLKLSEKLETKAVSSSFSSAQKNEVRHMIGCINDIFADYDLVKRTVCKGERLKKAWASKYFKEQATLNDCKKAKKGKDLAVIELAIKEGNKALKVLYPDKKNVVLTEVKIIDGKKETVNRDMVIVITDIIESLNKARSANRDDITRECYSLKTTKEYTVYSLTNKDDTIDIIRASEEDNRHEVVVFGTADKDNVSNMLYKEIPADKLPCLDHAVDNDIKPVTD